jgi:acyl-coenzyme A thioesterase 13
LCNPGGSLHGGYLAAIADDLTTYALMASDPEGRHGSTIDMSITFIKAALCGNAVNACARTLKAGRTLAFTECSFYDLKSGELLSHYKQTKYVSTGANTKLSKL